MSSFRYSLDPDSKTESEVKAAEARKQQSQAEMNIIRKSSESPSPVSRKGTGSKGDLLCEKTKNEEAAMMADIAKLNSMSIRFTKFKTLLDMPVIDLGRKLLRHIDDT